MKGQTFGLRFEIKQCAEGEDCNQGRSFLEGIPPKSTFVSRGATAFEIFRGGVSPVETVLGESHTSGPECVDSMFSRSRIKRRGQREKVASSNRMPGFRIRAYSGRFFRGRILPKNRFVSREFFIF